MKTNLLTLAAAVLLAGCNVNINIEPDLAKDNGPALSRTCPLDGDYHELEVSQAFDVVMSDTVGVPVVTLDSSLFDRLLFRIEGGTLKIGLKPGSYNNIQAASVLLPLNPRLDEIDLSGASSFIAESPLRSERMSIELSGASHFSGSIQNITGELDIDLSGASSAIVTGSTALLDIDLSGASHLDAQNLDATSVKGEICGASDARVLCCEQITVEVSGASSLTYCTLADGCTPVVNCPASGSSTVRSLTHFD